MILRLNFQYFLCQSFKNTFCYQDTLHILHFNHLKIISTLNFCESIARGWNSTWVQILLSEPEGAHLNSQQPHVQTKLWNIKVHIKIPASVTVTGSSIPFSILPQSLKNVLATKIPREVNEAVCLLSWKGQSSACLKYLPNSIIYNYTG